MEIKRTTARFSYRVEEKPGGGFIAHPSDPKMETLEGATKEEVQQKIQANISALIGKELPVDLKLGGVNVTVNRKVSVTCHTRSGASLSNTQQQSLPQRSDAIGELPLANSSDTSGTILRVIAALIAAAALIYFFLYR